MKAHRSSWRVAPSFIFVASLLTGCGDDSGSPNGTTPTVTITAPTIVRPDGVDVDDHTLLVVANVTVSNGSTPTYSFQVATDANFANVIVDVSDVAEDASGQTSWEVRRQLANGEHFWRARASAAGTDGPFSAVARFRVDKNVVEPGGREVLFDPLTDGMTRATNRGGGRLTPQGWQVLSRSDFLRYEVQPLSAGYVEWQMTGLKPENNELNQYMVMGMWDPTAGAYRENPFRVHVQKLHPPHNPPFVRLRWLSHGDVFEEGANYLRWDPEQTYTWLLEWGPFGEDSFFAFLYLDGRELIRLEYDRPYTPARHYIELGIAARQESIVDAVYSNLRIGEK